MRNFGEWIAGHRRIILILAILLLIPAGYSALNTELNYDILAYLPDEAESVMGQKIMDESFGSSGTGILIFSGIKDYEIKDVEKDIEALKGVKSVTWVRDLVSLTVPTEILPDEIRETFYQDNSVMLMVNFIDSSAADLTQEAVKDIRLIIKEKEGYLTGTQAIIRDVIELSDKEKNIYIGLAILLAIVVLALTLKSTVIPIIFLIGIGFGVIYNMGTNFFLPDISYVTSAIAGVLQLGVTMDYSIFLYHRYEEERERYHSHEKAMGVAIQKTAVSISGASLTTIAGFLALVAMQLTLGANIGIVMAKGVLLGVICTLTIMPSLLLVLDRVIHKFQHKTFLPNFSKISNFVVDKHLLFMIVGIALLLPAIYGANHKEVYYKLDTSLPKNMASIEGLEVMKEAFDMNSIYFVAVNRQLEDLKVKEMIHELEDVEGIHQVVGYQTFVGSMIPKEMIPDQVLEIFMNDEYSKFTIISQYSAASDQGNVQTETIKEIVKTYDQSGLVTGEIPMTKDLIDVTNHDIKVVNLLTVVLLLIIIGITFKSVVLPIILVLSIELAVLINMGIPYYTGTTIPFIASIIIGSIQMGTTVDYAILLTNRFREILVYEPNKKIAMQKALQSSSKSIVTSGLTFFFSTFAVAVVSNIDMISQLALMMGRGALISMVVIMIVLPALLLIFEGLISKTTIGWKRVNRSINNKTDHVERRSAI